MLARRNKMVRITSLPSWITVTYSQNIDYNLRLVRLPANDWADLTYTFESLIANWKYPNSLLEYRASAHNAHCFKLLSIPTDQDS